MAVGISESEANALLDSFSGSWLQLHTGDPGADGTANVATETTRKQVTLTTASGGTNSNSAAISWASYPATETITHVSLWSASTAGTFEISGTVTSGAVSSGDTARLNTGQASFSLSIAA